jgi:hypothetical protein
MAVQRKHTSNRRKEIRADIVISDLSINMALEMLGKEDVPDDIVQKAQKLLEKPVHMNDRGYERTSIFWGALAMMEPLHSPATKRCALQRGCTLGRGRKVLPERSVPERDIGNRDGVQGVPGSGIC